MLGISFGNQPTFKDPHVKFAEKSDDKKKKKKDKGLNKDIPEVPKPFDLWGGFVVND
jgi:hypothetical protein